MIYRDQDLSGHNFKGKRYKHLEIWNCNLAGAKWGKRAERDENWCGHFSLTAPIDSQGEPICAFFFNGRKYVNYRGRTYTYERFERIAKKQPWGEAVIENITIDSIFWGAHFGV